MKKKEYERLKAKLQALDDIYGELPDGAYFAVLEEHGIDVGDLAVLGDYEMAHGIEDAVFDTGTAESMADKLEADAIDEEEQEKA